MAHITLSIPDEVYHEMKQHPEIKWSEVARQNIIEKALLLKKKMHVKDFLKLVSPETQKRILLMDESKEQEYTKKVKGKEWKRAKYLTQV